MATDMQATEAGALTWARLESIAARHGPAFFLADLGRFERNCRRFLDAFQAIYPRTSIGYSYKTNYLPQFILRADLLGAYSEVVSSFEFDLARELGVPGERIIYNGPIKQREDLRRALGAGALVNADSIPEIWDIVGIADDLEAPTPVGIRCYVPSETADSRFGIDLEAPDAPAAIDAIDETAALRLAGLHCHYSGDRSADQYRRRTRAMIRLHHEALRGRPLDFIDMGGGFAGTMSPELARQLDSSSATFEDYATAVAGEMRAAYGEQGPRLVLEPGMALLADAMQFAARVEIVKLQHRPLAVIAGSGLNIQPPWNLLRRSINLPMRVLAGPSADPRNTGPWDVVGYTCIEGDLLHRGYRGGIGIGDYAVFDNVGAYTVALNAPFIRGTPPVVALDGARSGELLRPESTARDLLRSYTTDGDQP